MKKEENWHRRQAMTLVSQLPDGQEDALAVLRFAAELVTDFLADPEPTQRPAPVVQLHRP